MNMHVGVDVYLHTFLISALESASRSGPFTPGEEAPGTH
jgi:hypothetical protein